MIQVESSVFMQRPWKRCFFSKRPAQQPYMAQFGLRRIARPAV